MDLHHRLQHHRSFLIPIWVSIAPFSQEIQQENESGIFEKNRHFYGLNEVEKNRLLEIETGVGQSRLIDIGSLWQN